MLPGTHERCVSYASWLPEAYTMKSTCAGTPEHAARSAAARVGTALASQRAILGSHMIVMYNGEHLETLTVVYLCIGC